MKNFPHPNLLPEPYMAQEKELPICNSISTIFKENFFNKKAFIHMKAFKTRDSKKSLYKVITSQLHPKQEQLVASMALTFS